MSRLDFAKEIILQSYNEVFEKFSQNDLGIKNKSNALDMVTKIDLALDKFIVGKIKEAYPSDIIVSEESLTEELASMNDTWILDPIDGTMNLVHGFPDFVISLGLAKNDTATGGVILNPSTKDFYFGDASGVYFNGQQIDKLSETKLVDSLISYEPPFKKRGSDDVEKSFECYKKLYKGSHNVLCLGSTASALAYVSCGKLDAYISFNGEVKSWDVAAGVGLVLAGGGCVMYKDGKSTQSPFTDGYIIAANSFALANEIYAIMSG